MRKFLNKQKRIVAVALAIMCVLSAFALGASAITPLQYGLCDCFDGTEVIYEGDTLSQGDISLNVSCDHCGKEYTIFGEVYENLQKEHDDNEIVFSFNFYEEGDGVDIIVKSFEGEPINGTAFYIKSAIPVEAEKADGSIVGDMANSVSDTIGGLLQGIGHTVISFFDKVVLGADGGLSTLATWTLVLLGVSFGLGAIGFVIGKVRR